MAIPAFTEQGFLPEGIHDAAIEEIKARFGTFQGSDRRPKLWNRLVEYLNEATNYPHIEAFLLDGSFVTEAAEPNDIDLVVVVAQEHDFRADLQLGFYNLLAQNRVRQRFSFDIVVVKNGTRNMSEACEFFQQVRHQPNLRKGIVRLKL
jgi:hypothetical protein